MKPLSYSVLYMVLGLTPGKWNGEGPLGERRESIDHRGSHRNPLQNCFKKYWILGTIPRHSDLIDLRCHLCIRILQISLLKIRCIARAETPHITLFRNTAPYLPKNSAHSALAQCHSRHSRWKCLEELLVASWLGLPNYSLSCGHSISQHTPYKPALLNFLLGQSRSQSFFPCLRAFPTQWTSCKALLSST